MSVLYNGVVLTLDNYWEVLQDSDSSIYDEVRLAIMDDTNIGKYIDLCATDDYKLKQIRLALRDNFPQTYLLNNLNAECIRELRYMYKNNIDLGIVSDYLTLNNDKLIYILKAVHSGADISKINFNRVAHPLIPIIVKGLLYDYPMEIFEGHYETYLTEEYVNALMTCMRAGVDVVPFIKKKWDLEVIYLFISVANSKVDVNKLLEYITNTCDKIMVQAICQGVVEGYLNEEMLTRLCYRDEDGYYVYNAYQITALIAHIKDGTIEDDMFNPMLSDYQIRAM